MKLTPLSVAVVVKDLKRSKQFFVKKLGFKVLDDHGHWVTVGRDPKGLRIHLCETKPLEKGNTGICITVDTTVEKAFAALKKKGVKFPCPPTQREWGVECRFADPDGNEYWLMGK